MAVPARGSAADPGPDKAKPRKSDPLSPGWADVRAGVITQAVLMRMSVEELTLAVKELRMPDGNRRLDFALEVARLNLAVAERWEELARRCVLDQSVLDAIRADAYERGAADGKAARCHLEAVPD